MKTPIFCTPLLLCTLPCDLQCLLSQPFERGLDSWMYMNTRMGKCVSVPTLTPNLKRLCVLTESIWPLSLSWKHTSEACWRIRNHVESIRIIPFRKYSRSTSTQQMNQLNANTWESPAVISRTHLGLTQTTS